MRVAPDDPGGSITTRQGLTVNRITEGAVAEPAADRIVLAPAPLDLEEIDLSSASLPEATAPVPPVSSEETMALIDRLLEEAVPLEPLQDMPAAQASLTPMRPVIEVISTSIPGPSQSIRPPLRPESLQVAATAAAPAAPSAETTDLDAATLAVGTRLVQLGAFDDAETARSEWDRLARANPDFFRDKGRVIQQAVSGGREFFRLRAHGFTDLSDARRFCTALNARGAPCIPVTVR
jgi:cell division septation protein DedD